MGDAHELLEQDLDKMETELKAESKRLKELFEIKEKQIQNLTEQMTVREGALNAEREQTQAMTAYVRMKTEEFKRHLKRNIQAEDIKESEKLTGLFDEAISFYNSGNYTFALDKLNKIVQIQPRFGGAFQYLALCQWGMGNKKEARKMALRALELEPQNEQLKEWIESIQSQQ